MPPVCNLNRVAEEDNSRQRVDRNSGDNGALAFRNDRLAFPPQICHLGLDIEYVEEFLHVPTPSL